MVAAKVALVIIIGLIALFAGIMGYVSQNTTINERFSSVLESPTGYILALKGEEKILNFSASLEVDSYDIKLRFSDAVDQININYVGASDFKINSLSMGSSTENDVLLKNYKGKVLVSNTLTLDGSADEATINSVRIKINERRISIDVNDLEFNSLILTNTPKISLELNGVSGTITGDKFVYTAENEKIEISFRGDMIIDGNSISIDGEGIIKTSNFQAPTQK